MAWLKSSIRVKFSLEGAFGWGDWFVNRCDYGRDASDFGGGSGFGNTDHVWKCQAYDDRT